MSVVVAIKDNGRVYIGADSQVTKGGTRTTLRNPNNYKVWRVGDAPNCLMASVGTLRDANVVRLMEDLVTDYNVYRDEIDYKFVVRKIVPSIVNELKSYGFLKDEQYVESLDSSFLFAFQDKLYKIGFDCSVVEVSDFAAIGSGANEALGSLLSTDKLPPKERIVRAIKASAANDIYVDYPIILVDTKYGDFEIVTETNEKQYLTHPKKKGEDKNDAERA